MFKPNKIKTVLYKDLHIQYCTEIVEWLQEVSLSVMVTKDKHV